MTPMYQRKLEVVAQSNEKRAEAGRITRQNMLSLKALAGVKEDRRNPVLKALSTFFCFMFCPKFTDTEKSPEPKKEKRVSYNTSGFIQLS